MIPAPFLKANDRVALVAPGKSIVEFEGLIAQVEQLLRSWGLQPEVSPSADGQHDSYYHFAAPDADRLADLQSALDDPEIRAIICLRGGYGTSRLLDQLDFTGFRKAPKWIVGYSDITALHLHLNQMNFCSIHGPMPVEYPRKGYEAARKSVRKALFDGPQDLYFEGNHRGAPIEGRLLGGNLSLLVHLLGTVSEPDWTDSILFTEEVGEAPYRIDRMLLQLHRTRRLKQLKGILVGNLASSPEGQSKSETLFVEFARQNNLPLWTGFPCEHGPENRALFCGYRVRLTPSDKGTRLQYVSP
ncbi:MAG: LD-carboxypeptidase [Salibacteraceae bacterium]